MHYPLKTLDARFTKYHCEDVDPTKWIDGVLHSNGKKETYDWVDTLAEADGFWFKCPLCFESQHRHSVRIGFAGKATPGTYGYNNAGQPVLWNVSGTNLDDLVLTPSIQIQGGCNWHGFVGSSGIPPGHAG